MCLLTRQYEETRIIWSIWFGSFPKMDITARLLPNQMREKWEEPCKI